MKISLNEKTSIDLDTLILTRLLIQGGSGSGKSFLIRRILEQSHGKIQHIIFDLEGEFGTLREKFDYILAGKDGDVAAHPKTAGLLARKILELNVSLIVDLSELQLHERKPFVKNFIDSMIDAPKELHHPCLVVIDEAHHFVPQVGDSEAAPAVIDLCTRGRKRGYCAILATQRISKLHKDAAAECLNKLTGRTGLDIDMKRAADDLGFNSKEQLLLLRNLHPGEFFAYGPALTQEVTKMIVGDVKTTHPTIGSRTLGLVVPPTEKIKKVLSKLADLPQEAQKEATTLSDYKMENTTLKRELIQAKKERGPATEIKRIEVPAVGKRALEGLEKAESNMRKMMKTVKDGVLTIEMSVNKLSTELAKITNKTNVRVFMWNHFFYFHIGKRKNILRYIASLAL